MRRSKGKPKKWEWSLALGMTVGGLLLRLPFVPEPLRERLAIILFPTGILLALLLVWQLERFADLPPEEQRELERADRVDERKRMLRGQAAWLSWQVETAAGLIALIAVVVFSEDISLTFFYGVLILWWVRLLMFELFHWWLEKKY